MWGYIFLEWLLGSTLYFGDRNLNNSWKISLVGGDLLIYRKELGVWVLKNTLPLASSPGEEIRVVTGVNATYTSDNVIPANARLYESSFEVTQAYSAGTTISLGQVGSVALAMATNENTPEVLASKTIKDGQDVAWGAAALAALVTVNGAPAAGAGVAIFKYCMPKP
jgi:hypothetical protein